MRQREYTALGGDIFAGLFTLGVQQAGFTILGHVEHSDYGAATAGRNFKDLVITRISDSQNGVGYSDLSVGAEGSAESAAGLGKGVPPRLLESSGVHQDVQPWRHSLPRSYHNVDLFYTNPPCAPWSNARRSTPTATKAEAWKEDPRTQWVWDLAEIAVALNAKTWIWESVVPTWQRGRAFVLQIAEGLLDYGYSITVFLHNGMYCGGTQNRPRVMLIAHKHPLVWPAHTRPQSVAELLKGVPRHQRKEHKVYLSDARAELWTEALLHGGSLQRAQRALIEAGRGVANVGRQSFLDYRLRLNYPPPVVMSSTTRLHPTEPRCFTFAEIKVLCGLPPEWESAEGTLAKRVLECSRAVLPGVGRWVASAVLGGLNQLALKQQYTKLVDVRRPREPVEEGIAELLNA